MPVSTIPNGDPPTSESDLFSTVAEEIVVYPYQEKHLTNGPEMTENDRFHHQEIKEKLALLQGTSLEKEPGLYQQRFNDLFKKLSDHVEHEEAEDLTALEAAMSREESMRLANEFQRIKKFLPTRSIPSAPNHPDDGQTLVAFMAKPVTAIADAFRSFPKHPDAKL